MHPEVLSDQPGRCPKCGMPLVVQGAEAKRADDRGLGKPDYTPLIVIVAMITAVSAIVSSDAPSFIARFMAGFFLVFGGFKLMDLKGFAQGYSTYDLLAGKWFAYGYMYPFIELAFGFLMLAGYHPEWLLWTEAGVMVFSGLGVVRKLMKHEKFQCACLGTFLKVPLTYVTLVEDFGMALLAMLLILMR